MALIADLVAALKRLAFDLVDRWADIHSLEKDDLIRMRDAVIQAWEIDDPTKVGEVEGVIDRHRAMVVTWMEYDLQDAASFTSKLLKDWSVLLNDALGQFNVDVPLGTEDEKLGDPAVAKQVLKVLGDRAQYRVSAVLTTVNAILAMGAAASYIAEGSTFGIIRSIAQHIQSWVWANGIGGLTSIAYQPQMGASVIPILNRVYNQRSRVQVPGPGDQVRFQLREVYEPDRRKDLLGKDDLSTFKHFMGELGFSDYHADSYWAAHWVLPSITQLNEMLHRGVINLETWRQFVRFNDYDPSALPWLEETIFSPFTRVDARRMASLGVLDDSQLLQSFRDLGFWAPTEPDENGREVAQEVDTKDFMKYKAQGMMVWTKMFNALPVLRARFRRGYINPDQLLEALEKTGISPEKAKEQWETIVTVEKEARTEPEKQLTRGLVARAWKLRTIGFQQAVYLLERMGWDNAEAELILRVQSLPDDPLAFVNTALGVRLTGLAPFYEEFEDPADE